jgi:hypothetical protein
MMTLDDFLDLHAKRPLVWGESDCVQFGLQWAKERTGRPLTAMFDYHSQKQAISALRARGGLERIVPDWMGRNGFRPTETPDDGDVGLAPVASGVDPFAVVIRYGPWWISREPKGIGGMQFEKIRSWRII